MRRLRSRKPIRLPRAAQAPAGATEPRKADAPTAFAEKANDLEALKKAVDDAATVGGGLWLSYLFALFYLAIATGSVTHVDLFFERPIHLLFFNVDLPIVAFFALAPLLFLALHAYALVHLVFLAEKAKRFHLALYDQVGAKEGMSEEEKARRKRLRDGLRGQLPSNVFVQFLAGPPETRGGLYGLTLRAIGWFTLSFAPVLLLLLIQVQFLPYHSAPITWAHRFALLLDLALIWWLWRRILVRREPDENISSRRALVALGWNVAGGAASVAAIAFAFILATFCGEPAATFYTRHDPTDRLAWLHEYLFHSKVDEGRSRRAFLLSDTLVLWRLNVMEELKIDSLDKAKGREFLFVAQYRDFAGAEFEDGKLGRLDLTGANLTGANLSNAQLQVAWLPYAHLQGANLLAAWLEGAFLSSANLQGADLLGARLQAASLESALLQGARLSGALLHGADLINAQMEAADLWSAELLGANLLAARIDATDFYDALFWRSAGGGSTVSIVRFGEGDRTWLPRRFQPNGVERPWTQAEYLALKSDVETWLPANTTRSDVTTHLAALDCADPNRASCDEKRAMAKASDGDPWRNQLLGAVVSDDKFDVAFARKLRELVCSKPGDSSEDPALIARGAGFHALVHRQGPAYASLLSDLLDKSGKACPLAARLTGVDRSKLAQTDSD